MSKLAKKVILVGDEDCGKRKFIDKFFCHYPAASFQTSSEYKIYICEGIYYPICLININEPKILTYFSDADVMILSHSSDNPKSFQSLRERWIPLLEKLTIEHTLVMDNFSTEQDSLTESLERSVSNNQVTELANCFGLLWCTSYSSGYKEAFAIIKSVFEEELIRDPSAKEEISIKYYLNPLSVMHASPIKLSVSRYLPVGQPIRHPIVDLSQNRYSAVKLSENKYPVKLNGKFPPDELSSSEYSTVKLTPKRLPKSYLMNINKSFIDEFNENPFSIKLTSNQVATNSDTNGLSKSSLDKCYPTKSNLDECTPNPYLAN